MRKRRAVVILVAVWLIILVGSVAAASYRLIDGPNITEVMNANVELHRQLQQQQVLTAGAERSLRELIVDYDRLGRRMVVAVNHAESYDQLERRLAAAENTIRDLQGDWTLQTR